MLSRMVEDSQKFHYIHFVPYFIDMYLYPFTILIYIANCNAHTVCNKEENCMDAINFSRIKMFSYIHFIPYFIDMIYIHLQY